MGQCAQGAIGEITSYSGDLARKSRFGVKKSRLRVSQKYVADKWKEVSNQGGGYV